MDDAAKERIRALCERVAAFIEANDTLNENPLTASDCYGHMFREGNRSAWIIDAQGRKWRLSITKGVTDGVLATRKIEIASALELNNVNLDYGPLPCITLRLDAYPETRRSQEHIRERLARSQLVVQRRQWFQPGERGIGGSWIELAPDAWIPNERQLIVVEFELDGVEALVEDILHGTAVKDEVGLRWRRERAEHGAAVRCAYDHVIVLTPGEQAQLRGAYLVSLGPLHADREYMAFDMSDMADWLGSTRLEMRSTLVLDAFRGGAELIGIGTLEESGGLVTAQLVQDAEMFIWRDRERGVAALAELRHGRAAHASPDVYDPSSLGRDVTLLTEDDLARTGRESLESIASLDPSSFRFLHALLEPSDVDTIRTYDWHLESFLRRKAAALGGTIVTYDRDASTGQVRGATVYRPRAAVHA